MKKSKLLWILSITLIIINLIWYTTRLGGDNVLTIVGDTLPVICSFISAICLYLAVKGFQQLDFTKKAWLLIFIGISLSFIAELLYSIFEVGMGKDMNEYFPSLADYFWCAGYIPMFIGLLTMFIGYKKSGFPMGNKMVYLLLSFVYLILFIAVSYFLLYNMIVDEESSGIQKFFNLFYPVADTFLVIPAFILMYITSLFGGGSISKPWKYLALGYICFTFADLIYGYLNWQGKYESGNFIDIAWHIGYLLIGLAGLYQRELIDSFKEGIEK